MSLIPKILVQTSKNPQPAHVNQMWKERTDPSWKIEWFDDAGAIQYFKDNPIPELPNIVEVFNSFGTGCHKGDLFRYYYLYLNGGFYVDTDMMIHVHMNTLLFDEYDHILVLADIPLLWTANFDEIVKPPYVFNALIGCVPKSKLIYDTLVDLYKAKPRLLAKYYNYTPWKLYVIYDRLKHNFNIKLFDEKQLDENPVVTHTVDTVGNRIATHYFRTKEIPIPERLDIEAVEVIVDFYTEFKIWIHNPDKDLYVSRCISLLKTWEPTITQVIYDSMKPGGIFVDIGANIGWHSKVVQSAGFDVIAFEPQLENFELLTRNCKKEGSLLYNVGLGKQNELRRIEKDPNNYGNSFISENGEDVISVVKLDDMIDAETVKKVSSVKIDVQGFDTEVLKGGKNFFSNLNKGTTILLEVAPLSPTVDLDYILSFVYSQTDHYVFNIPWIDASFFEGKKITFLDALDVCRDPKAFGCDLEFDQCGPFFDMCIIV